MHSAGSQEKSRGYGHLQPGQPHPARGLPGPEVHMAKPVTHVCKSVNTLAGGQEKDPFWGFCQTCRGSCQKEVRPGGGQMWPRLRQRLRWPQQINPLTRAITLFQAQSIPLPRLDHGKVVPCALFSSVACSTPTGTSTQAQHPEAIQGCYSFYFLLSLTYKSNPLRPI